MESMPSLPFRLHAKGSPCLGVPALTDNLCVNLVWAMVAAGTDMGTSYFLPRHAGLGIANEMLLTGRALSAERAHQV